MSQSNKEARILLALQAYQNTPKLSLRGAAKLYQVKHSTLFDRYNGIQARVNTIPNSRRLSDLEEQILIYFILDLDSRGFPPRLRGVKEMADQLLADRDALPVGARWAHNFVRRHPDLKTRFFRKYDYQRAKCEDPAIIRNWFTLVANTISKYGIRSDDLYNFDETGFLMGMIASGMVVTGSERRSKPKSVQPGNREWITVIQAINADGQAISPFIIGAGQYHLANWYRDSNLPGDWAIATTQNGWTDNETGLEWLKHFDWCTAKRSNSRYRLLIHDGHESHHSIEFERYCEEKKIIRLCMPPHSSHILQPLDVGCFSVLKNAYGQEIEHLIRCSITHVSKTEFFPAFYAAFQATMTEKNIKSAFRGAGLVPLDPESVVSKLDVQLRTPTPAEEVAKPSTPWVSKTPKTVLEAQSHYPNDIVPDRKEFIYSALFILVLSISRETDAGLVAEACSNLTEAECSELMDRQHRVRTALWIYSSIFVAKLPAWTNFWEHLPRPLQALRRSARIDLKSTLKDFDLGFSDCLNAHFTEKVTCSQRASTVPDGDLCSENKLMCSQDCLKCLHWKELHMELNQREAMGEYLIFRGFNTLNDRVLGYMSTESDKILAPKGKDECDTAESALIDHLMKQRDRFYLGMTDLDSAYCVEHSARWLKLANIFGDAAFLMGAAAELTFPVINLSRSLREGSSFNFMALEGRLLSSSSWLKARCSKLNGLLQALLQISDPENEVARVRAFQRLLRQKVRDAFGSSFLDAYDPSEEDMHEAMVLITMFSRYSPCHSEASVMDKHKRYIWNLLDFSAAKIAEEVYEGRRTANEEHFVRPQRFGQILQKVQCEFIFQYHCHQLSGHIGDFSAKGDTMRQRVSRIMTSCNNLFLNLYYKRGDNDPLEAEVRKAFEGLFED
ncbi:hypothetical protein NM208_g6395 [Fusarium decemcellulare]|uniref:Uncharacterized protein n=1 Tax=Fusarium decemcellulare TaxID=57161 RepID=A0ACC1SD77_9HYPO|nr:hypothetical protein NM208_g6395 [Fusarium decemcellulare]